MQAVHLVTVQQRTETESSWGALTVPCYSGDCHERAIDSPCTVQTEQAVAADFKKRWTTIIGGVQVYF